VLGLCIVVGSLLLPKALFGDPDGPKYFPLLVGAVMAVMSLVDFGMEWKKRRENQGLSARLKAGRAPRLLIGSILISLVYSFIFEKAGFLVSTILFLGAELFLVNGRRKWLANILVAVLFTLALWYAFARLLGINLP